MNPLCVLFDRIGPYHGARLNAAAALGPTMAVELFGGKDEPTERVRFTRVTLFKKETSHSSRDIARSIDQILHETQPVAVAVPGWSHPLALAALAWCLRANRPAIVMSDSQRCDRTRRWPLEMLKKSLVNLCSTGLVAGTAHVDYLATLGMSRERIFTGYDVVDNDYFQKNSDAARQQPAKFRARLNLPQNYFLASSRFIPKKNLRRLIDAYNGYRALVGQAAWKLVLLGDGPLRGQLAAQIEKLHLTKDIVLPGFQPYAELPAYYGLAKAFVHASTTEQWGLVVNEAMAGGLPVLVSSRCGCAPDLVHPGRNGFTFDPLDTSSLIQLLRQISTVDCDRTAMGNASREIIQHWSPQLFAANLRRAVDIALKIPRCETALWNRLIIQLLLRGRNP
jgi:1,2-diacylglycerol 3-alpha-glucosyltransferase